MPFIQSEDYEELGATYQVFMMHWLNDALQIEGIVDKDKRRAIIRQFCTLFGTWNDHYWFEADDKKVFPLVAFCENGPAASQQPTSLGDVLLPNELFSFQEYVGGNLMHYFDELDEDISGIDSGLE